MQLLRQKWFRSDLSFNNIKWNTYCDILEEYCRQFGTCNCPYPMVCVLDNRHEYKIGWWLAEQRKRKRNVNGSLSPERESRLQSLVDQGKLAWDLKDVVDSDWDMMYGLLVNYGRKFGSCNVPLSWQQKLPNGKGAKLGVWLNSRLKEKDTMPLEQRQRLQELVDQGLLQWHPVSSDSQRSLLPFFL